MSKLAPSLNKEDVTIEMEEVAFQGFFRMSKLTLKHSLFEGGQSQSLTRERFDRGPAVGVLLYDQARDTVVLIEQFRVGALNEISPWIFELVAGMVEPGEQPEDVAHRETLEEAGAKLEKLIPICEYLVSPGGTDEKLHVYLGLVDSQHIEGVHGLPEEGEDIKIHKVSSQQAFEGVADGSINNGATVIAIQWLEIQKLKGLL
jgi:ADP-ribose pyrophosphatase